MAAKKARKQKPLYQYNLKDITRDDKQFLALAYCLNEGEFFCFGPAFKKYFQLGLVTEDFTLPQAAMRWFRGE